MPKLAVRALGLVNPMLRELPEIAYQFDEPFILDTRNTRPPSGRPHPAEGCYCRDRRLVPDPAGHAMTSRPEAVNAMTTPLIPVTP